MGANALEPGRTVSVGLSETSHCPSPHTPCLWGLCQTVCLVFVCGCSKYPSVYKHLSGPRGVCGALTDLAGRPGGFRGEEGHVFFPHSLTRQTSK